MTVRVVLVACFAFAAAVTVLALTAIVWWQEASS